MPPFLSVYLDLVRVGAALLVAVSHVWPLVAPGVRSPLFGHPAVIVFFVLSGFVIAFVCDGRDRTIGQYAVNRLARLWSVAIPALLIGMVGAVLLGATRYFDAAPPAPDLGDNLLRSGLNLLYLGQMWRLDVMPPLNDPFWSLNYEAWYYAIFGAWTFLRGPVRLPMTLLLAVAAGPNILLLMPAWLAGVALYRLRSRLAFSPPAALALFVCSGALYLLQLKFNVGTAFRDWLAVAAPQIRAGLNWSVRFPGDWLTALAITLNFAAASRMGRYGGFLVKLKRPIAVAASYTLSIYLYHMPVGALLAAAGLRGWPLAVGLTACIVGLGRVTEHQRPALRAALHRIGRHMPARAVS